MTAFSFNRTRAARNFIPCHPDELDPDENFIVQYTNGVDYLGQDKLFQTIEAAAEYVAEQLPANHPMTIAGLIEAREVVNLTDARWKWIITPPIEMA